MYTNNLDDLNLSQHQLELLKTLKHWVLTEAEFSGRSDDESLILFLNACDYDVESTKAILTRYYKCRRDTPQWWTDRNTNNKILLRILKLRVATPLLNSRVEQPLVFIVSLRRLDPTIAVDDFLTAATVAIQVSFLIRWKNAIKSDGILVFDWRDYDFKTLMRFLSPITLGRMAYNFYNSSSIKFKKVIFLNVSFIIKKMVPFIFTFFPSDVKNKLVICGSDISTLTDHVPSDMLPEEYGGQGKPLKYHEDTFESELLTYNDYILDDDKYGYTNRIL